MQMYNDIIEGPNIDNPFLFAGSENLCQHNLGGAQKV